MKKTIITVFAFMVIFGFAVSGTMAQTWTWNDPYPVTIPTGGKYVKVAADPASNALYGIDFNGAVSSVITTTAVSTSTDAPDTLLVSADDLVVGFGGVVYVIDADTVGVWNGTSFIAFLDVQQPKVPDGKIGTFKNIASGNNGKLYVLFEVSDAEQYLLVGNPPITAITADVKITPQSLNLGSKGNWVTCRISNLSGGLPVGEIVLASVCVTDINGVQTSVCPALGSPSSVGDSLMVKFSRSELAAAINLAAPGASTVTITVTGSGGAGEGAFVFTGSDTIKTKPAKTKKPK
jgi:hypothetical protein